MAEIIEWRRNNLGFSHVICLDCESDQFYVQTDEAGEVFEFLICAECGNAIPVFLKPVFDRG